MKIGSTYSGFLLKREEYIKEISSFARVFEHKKSGARLVHLENDDENKVFSISFKTPPSDNTGLPHILEHSVLCGSKNFPTKDPFLELIKSSLKTFLNAMTYPDKTVYPVASKNEKDFSNLINVYLDAVFHPNIYEKPEIFMQEGYHYHLEDEKDKLFLNGVVYSEMKGSYSSVERLLEHGNLRSLYSDTAYGFDPGGDPEKIPELTYKEFLGFHKKYYHPSNSYIFLYGNLDIREKLKLLDEKYLSSFKKQKVDASLGIQKPFKKIKRINLKYSISKSESSEGKSYFSLNYAFKKDIKQRERFALEVLVYYLMKAKSAPLKKALLKEKIGESVFGHFEDEILTPYASVCVRNSDQEKVSKFLKIVSKNLKQYASEGLDKNLLAACLNNYEFALREADSAEYPKGLFYNLSCLKTWLYDGDPLEYLSFEKIFKELHKLSEQGYFEKLIEKYFLKNTRRSLVILNPEKGLLEKKEKKLQKELDLYKKKLSKEEIRKLVKQTLDFKKYQEMPDSLKDINKIPKLKIEDLKKEIEKIPTKKETVSDLSLLHNPLDTNGICYLNLAFDTRAVPLQKLYSLNILAFLLGMVATKNYTYEELDVFIQKYTGGCSFNRETFLLKHDDSKYMPNLVVKGKVLNENFAKLTEILLEIMTKSSFEDKEHVEEIIQEVKSKLGANIDPNGDSFAVSRLLSYFSEHGKYEEYTGGITFYQYLCDLLKDFDKKWPCLKDDLSSLCGIVFNRANLVSNVVCEEEQYLPLKGNLVPSLLKLENLPVLKQKYDIKIDSINEGLLTQNSVQNVVQGNNFKILGYKFSGKLLVLRNIATMEYLLEELRLKGGAYGGGCNITRSGNIFLYSYLDPNLAKTLEIYEKMPRFLENFKTENMDKFVVGTIGSLDRPLTPSMKGEKTLAMHLSNITEDDLQKERNEVLSTTQKDIRGFSGLLRASLKKKYFCVLGNEGNIKGQKKLFKKLVLVNK